MNSTLAGRRAGRPRPEIPHGEPDFNLEKRVPRLFSFKYEEDSERMMERLRKAGLPE